MALWCRLEAMLRLRTTLLLCLLFGLPGSLLPIPNAQAASWSRNGQLTVTNTTTKPVNGTYTRTTKSKLGRTVTAVSRRRRPARRHDTPAAGGVPRTLLPLADHLAPPTCCLTRPPAPPPASVTPRSANRSPATPRPPAPPIRTGCSVISTAPNPGMRIPAFIIMVIGITTPVRYGGFHGTR